MKNVVYSKTDPDIQAFYVVWDNLEIQGSCSDLNVCVLPNLYIEILIPEMMAVGGGTFKS